MIGSNRYAWTLVLASVVSVVNAATSCTAGSYSVNGSTCIKASPGYFVASAGATSQTACAAGTATLVSGSTYCPSCPPQLYSKAASSSCLYCPNGKETKDHLTCTKCAPGFYSSYGEACQISPVGYYTADGVFAAPCPSGTFSTSKGVQSLKGCTSCPTGTSNLAGGTQCFTNYARFVRYDASGNDISTTFATGTSEGNCASVCVARGGGFDHYTYSTNPNGDRYKTCFCKNSFGTAATFSPSLRSFIANVIGTCAAINTHSYNNCQNIFFASDNSCNVIGGGSCNCFDSFAAKCDSITGTSTQCIPYYSLDVNNLCQPSTFARYAGYDTFGNDISGQNYNGIYSSAACAAKCTSVNPSNGPYTSFSTSGVGNCYCKNVSFSNAAIQGRANFDADFVGTCALYASKFPGVTCQDVKY